jgi:HPt (histidine-containing phosphotransfer) domain-containing protein
MHSLHGRMTGRVGSDACPFTRIPQALALLPHVLCQPPPPFRFISDGLRLFRPAPSRVEGPPVVVGHGKTITTLSAKGILAVNHPKKDDDDRDDQCDSIRILVDMVAALGPEGPIAALTQLTHRLSGLAGTIGFPTISARASMLEDLVRRADSGIFDVRPARDDANATGHRTMFHVHH